MSFLGNVVKLLSGKPLRSNKALEASVPMRAQVYNLLQPGDNDPYWQRATSADADSTTTPEARAQLRNRARLEMENCCYAEGMVSTVVDNCIGTGPRLSIHSETSEAAANRLEAQWNEWVEEVGLVEDLQTALRAKIVDGESFGVLQTNGALQHPVKLDWTLYEADYFQTPWNYVNWRDEQTGVLYPHYDGIDFDQWGNPIRYWKLLRHPGSQYPIFLGAEYFESIAAQYVIHLFKAKRPGQSRGVSELQAALDRFVDLRDYTQASLRAAHLAAQLSAVFKTPMPPGEGDDIDGGPCQKIQLPNTGAGMFLPDGWDATQLKAEQPVDNFRDFTNVILREVGRCQQMPFTVVAGDSSEMNYASGRLDHQNYHRSLNVLRRYLERECLNRIWTEWFAEATIAGVVPRIGSNFQVIWTWDGHPHVDPQKEAEAQKAYAEIGVFDEAAFWRREGKAIDEVHASQRRSADSREQHNLPPLGGQATGQASNSTESVTNE